MSLDRSMSLLPFVQQNMENTINILQTAPNTALDSGNFTYVCLATNIFTSTMITASIIVESKIYY